MMDATVAACRRQTFPPSDAAPPVQPLLANPQCRRAVIDFS